VLTDAVIIKIFLFQSHSIFILCMCCLFIKLGHDVIMGSLVVNNAFHG
jgi:hypothetical protein